MLQRRRPPVPRPRPRVKLHQIDAVGLKITQTSLQPLPQVRLRVSLLHRVIRTRRPAPLHRRDLRRRLSPLPLLPAQRLGTHPLAPTVAVTLGRIDEVTPQLNRLVQRRDRVLILLAPPAPANRPGAKPDLGDAPPEPSERAMFHA